MSNEMQTGKVKWFDWKKGFGFVIPIDGSPEVYVSLKVLEKAAIHKLETDDAVSFSVTERGGRRFVENIVVSPRAIEKSAKSAPQARKSQSQDLGPGDDFEREWASGASKQFLMTTACAVCDTPSVSNFIRQVFLRSTRIACRIASLSSRFRPIGRRTV